MTDQPDAAWVVQQLREAFPLDTAPRHLILDRDGTFSAHVVSTVKSFGTKPTRTSRPLCLALQRGELSLRVIVAEIFPGSSYLAPGSSPWY